VYDPATNAWSAAPALGGLKRYNAQAFCRGGLLLLLGGVRQEMGAGSALGVSYDTPCMMHNLADASWCPMPAPRATRSAPAYGIVGDEVFVVGGEGVVSNSSEVLALPKSVERPAAATFGTSTFSPDVATASGAGPVQAAVVAAPVPVSATAPPMAGYSKAVRSSVSVHVDCPMPPPGEPSGVLSAVRTMQLSHELETVPDCNDLVQLYAETAEVFGVAASRIMYVTRNTPRADMDKVRQPRHFLFIYYFWTISRAHLSYSLNCM